MLKASIPPPWRSPQAEYGDMVMEMELLHEVVKSKDGSKTDHSSDASLAQMLGMTG